MVPPFIVSQSTRVADAECQFFDTKKTLKNPNNAFLQLCNQLLHECLFFPFSPQPPLSSQSCVACSQTTGRDCIAYTSYPPIYTAPYFPHDDDDEEEEAKED